MTDELTFNIKCPQTIKKKKGIRKEKNGQCPRGEIQRTIKYTKSKLRSFWYIILAKDKIRKQSILCWYQKKPNKQTQRASLVAQWLRICLPMQGTRVRALVWEDPTCRGAAGPREPQLLSLRVWSLCSAAGEAAIVRGPRTAMKSEIGRAHV